MRRAAALALKERGAAAAPATAALAAQLDIPEVRIPALRALEHIGPGAAAAIPKIATLYRSNDSFVRLAATLALRPMGAPAAAALQVALIGEDKQVARIAGMALQEYGPASVGALPSLIKLLDGSNHEKEVALMVIAGIGPGAAAAVPKMVETWPDYFLRGYPRYVTAFAAIGRPAAEPAIPLIEKLLRKEVDPGSGVYLNHEVGARGHHALFVLTGEKKHLQSMLQEISGGVNGEIAAELLRDLGTAAAEIVPETRQLLEKGGLPPDRWTGIRNQTIASSAVTFLEEFIAIATGDQNTAK